MKDIIYYLFVTIIIYYIVDKLFDNFSLEQENFDPSLVPISSIITLAKLSQKLINSNEFINTELLQIGFPGNNTSANFSVYGNAELVNLTVPKLIVRGNIDKSTAIVDNLDNLTVTGVTTADNIIGTNNTTIKGTLTVNGNPTVTNQNGNNRNNLTSFESYQINNVPDVIVNESTIIYGNLDVKNSGNFESTLDVKDTTEITGLTTISNLTATNPNILNGKLTVNGSTTINGTLDVINSKTKVTIGNILNMGGNDISSISSIRRIINDENLNVDTLDASNCSLGTIGFNQNGIKSSTDTLNLNTDKVNGKVIINIRQDDGHVAVKKNVTLNEVRRSINNKTYNIKSDIETLFNINPS